MTELEQLHETHETLAKKADEKRTLMLEGKATRRAWHMALNKSHKAFIAWWSESCKQHRMDKLKG